MTLNRGFGGSHFADSARYADRIIVPYHPKKIVVYAGDNDIAQGKTPDQVFADFQALVKAIRSGLGDVRIIVLSIKPSIARLDKYDLMRQVNERMADMAKKDPRLLYVDVGTCLLGADGKPRADLFMRDGLHLNAEGYRLWSEILRPFLKAD